MTSADTSNASVCILIDAPDDGVIEDFAWVKVTTITPDPATALARLEREFPVDEQGDGDLGESKHYVHRGHVWLTPTQETDEGWRWQTCTKDAKGAEEFYRFEVVNDGD